MGLTYSKSIKVGAIRFNFSGSGIGMSAGVRGLRLGVGPRGAYVSGGIGGFRYRQSLGGKSQTAARRNSPLPPLRPAQRSPEPGSTVAPPSEAANTYGTEFHDARDILELVDSSDDELLASMNEQRKKGVAWPWLGAVLIAAFTILLNNTSLPSAVYLLVFALGCALTYWLSLRESLNKLTVLFFEPDTETSAAFETLVSGLNDIARQARLEAQTATTRYVDTRYTAGAASGVSMVAAQARLGQGPGIQANIEVPILKSSATTLAFYPDRVLAFQKNNVAAFSYEDIAVELSSARFVERRNVTADAVVVGHTWQYVNKNGSPDRRFKDNRQIPLCLYGEMQLGTAGGLDLRFMGSREKGFHSFAEGLAVMQKTLKRRAVPPAAATRRAYALPTLNAR